MIIKFYWIKHDKKTFTEGKNSDNFKAWKTRKKIKTYFGLKVMQLVCRQTQNSTLQR